MSFAEARHSRSHLMYRIVAARSTCGDMHGLVGYGGSMLGLFEMSCGLNGCCRICARSEKVCVPIFEEEGKKRQLLLKIKTCLQITIKEDDQLPKKVCELCIARLEASFEFMEECLKGQMELHSQLQRISTTVKCEDSQTGVKMEDADSRDQLEILDLTESGAAVLESLRGHRAKWPPSEGGDKDVSSSMSPESCAPQENPVSHRRFCRGAHCEECEIAQFGGLPLLVEVIERSASHNRSLAAAGDQSKVRSEAETSGLQQHCGAGAIAGRKEVSCEFCGKTLTHMGDLNKHRRRHTGERPYACEFCGKRFSHTSNLLRHRKVHTGEKPFSCQTCGKAFSRKDKLVSHNKGSRCSPATSAD